MVTTIQAERRLPYAAADLMALVSDVRAYPDFIPWLKELTVLSEKSDGESTELVARAIVGWRSFVERFTSAVRTNRTEKTVDVGLVDGPFRKLENKWRFADDGQGGAIVKFWIAYQFKNPLLQALASVNRDLAAGRIMAAFEAEAKRRFGS
jgi:coenzyme Q-binding protein COQ10